MKRKLNMIFKGGATNMMINSKNYVKVIEVSNNLYKVNFNGRIFIWDFNKWKKTTQELEQYNAKLILNQLSEDE